MRIAFFVFCVLSLPFNAFSQQVHNVFIVTLDGLRWQELYGGAVDSLVQSDIYTEDQEQIANQFLDSDREVARHKLMPWFWTVMANEGQLYGNRWNGGSMTCSNRYWFSYPGYNEILTGYSDPSVDSNAKKYNKNKTVLEWLHDKPEFISKVAAFCSWDVFPYIINDVRSGIPVNAGFEKADDPYLSIKEQLLNELQDEIPSPWGSVRLDAFTHHYMLEYVKKHHPRVVYVSYGETDDFAHDGRYDHYLKSAHQTDKWISEIWDFIQSDPFYRDRTNLVITTDHGRGTSPIGDWKNHGVKSRGSNEIWAAAIGPTVPAIGEVKNEQLIFQNQIAKTVAKMLGYDYNPTGMPVGEVIHQMMEP